MRDIKKKYIAPITEVIEVERNLMQATSWTDPNGGRHGIKTNEDPEGVPDDDESFAKQNKWTDSWTWDDFEE